MINFKILFIFFMFIYYIMSSNIVYHTADVEATQDFYVEYNNVDFILAVGPGRSLVQNSVRLIGDVRILDENGAIPDNSGGEGFIGFNHRIGCHSFIESCQTTFSGLQGGIKENIQNYARWVYMSSTATLADTDYNSAALQCEHRAPNQVTSQAYAGGCLTRGTTPIQTDLDFSVRPLCILNRMEGDHLPFEKSGDIRLTFNLARNIAALQGVKAGNGAAYQLRNLRLSYNSVPTVGTWSDTATSMRSVYNIKSTLLSGSANVAAQVPAVCDAVSCSFQRQSDENVNVVSNLKCNVLPGIRNLQFQFNNSTSQYVTYEMNDNNEMLHRYLDSFSHTGYNQTYLANFRDNQSFGVGLEFKGFIDLTQQQFGIQITSDITNADPYNLYSYFHSLIRV